MNTSEEVSTNSLGMVSMKIENKPPSISIDNSYRLKESSTRSVSKDIPVSPIIKEKRQIIEGATARTALIRAVGLGYVHTIENEVYVIASGREAYDFAVSLNKLLPANMKQMKMPLCNYFKYTYNNPSYSANLPKCGAMNDISCDPVGLTSAVCSIIYVLECTMREVDTITGIELNKIIHPFKFAMKYMGIDNTSPTEEDGIILDDIYALIDSLLI